MLERDFYTQDPAGIAALPTVGVDYDVEEEERRAQEMLVGAWAGAILAGLALAAWVWVGVV